jgi:glycerol-3-phosphate dehydrogenase
MRGLRTGLVEQHDFAFGTSSRSSRLLHGGIRYLAQGRLGMVREASRERGILFRIAPHLTEPLPFIFPAYQGTRWPIWQLRIGVKIYDWLGGKSFGNAGGLTQEQTLRALPGLKTESLTGAVRYYDALTNDARLVLDTLRSAARNGAALVNYVRFENSSFNSGLWECALDDRAGGKRFTVRTRAVVNATGPWGGRIPHSQLQLRLTKGIHLVFDRGRLPVTDAVVITEGKRILFVIPWGGRVITGTTDTDYIGSLDAVEPEPSDIRYLLNVLNEFFPGTKLSAKDVLSSWAGLRPLIAQRNGLPSEISRRHQISNPEPSWWDVAGGKLTTYRLIAEQTVDQIASRLNLSASACRTAEEPLLPAGDVHSFSSVLPPPFSREAVEHYCVREWARHLDDVMTRRASWLHYVSDAEAKANQVSVWMGELLGWTEQERKHEMGLWRRKPMAALP